MTSSQSSTNYFTRAMELTHMYLPDVTKQERQEAERYLMALRTSADGLNLAFHIINNEPIDDFRCFWAFNTIMHHLPSLASNVNHAQTEELYRTLFSFIYRYFFSSSTGQRPTMDFLANKHAQMMVVGLQEFFPSRWSSFFDDAFELLARRDTLPHVSDAVTVYFLRLFQYIDERVVSVRAQADRCRELRVRDMELKDAMRDHVMPRAVSTWYIILCDCRIRAPDIVKVCLTVIQTYIEWVDVTLFINSEWINLFYFLVTTHAVRAEACECILSLVEKKQLPTVKYESLRTLNIVDAIPRIIALLQVLPESEEDENFLEVVSRLTRAVAEQLLCLFEHLSSIFSSNAASTNAEGTLNKMNYHTTPCSSNETVNVVNMHNNNNNNNKNNNNPNYNQSNLSRGKGDMPLPGDVILSRDSFDSVSGALEMIVTQLLCLLSIHHSSVSSTLLPFVQTYIKSQALREEQVTEILLRLYDNSLIRGLEENEDKMWLDDIIDQRKQIHNLIRLLYRRYPSIVQRHLLACIKRVSSPFSGARSSPPSLSAGGELNVHPTINDHSGGEYQQSHHHGMMEEGPCIRMNNGATSHNNSNNNNNNNNNAEETEAALRYLYELGESIRVENMYDMKNDFPQLVSIVLSSEHIAQCPCAVVHLSYFEVLDRYSSFFLNHNEWVPMLLQRFLLSPYGVTNRHPSVRARICYLFGHLIQVLKTTLLPHKKQIINALNTIFSSSVLLSSDRYELYEATGNLLSIVPNASTNWKDEDGAMIVCVTEALLNNLRDMSSPQQVVTGNSACSEALADSISFLSALMKGLRGGNDSTSSTAAAAATCSVNLVAKEMFHNTTRDVVNALSLWHTSASVRDRTAQYFTQIVHLLSFEDISTYFPVYITNWLTWMEAVPELIKLLRLFSHFIHRSGARVAAMLADTLPLVLRKVISVGDLSTSSEDMGIISETAREKREVYRQLFALLQAVSQAGCARVIISLPLEDVNSLLSQMLAAIHLTGEMELTRMSLQIMIKITTTVWDDNLNAVDNNDAKEGFNNNNNNNNSSSSSSCGHDWLLFVLNQIVPALLQRLLLPAFDLKDAKSFFLLGETGLLLKTLMNRLGPNDPSLCVLLYNLLQPVVGEAETSGFVEMLQREAQFSTGMKMRFRNMLQAAKEHQAIGGSLT